MPEYRDVAPLRHSIAQTSSRNAELGITVSSISLPALKAALDACPPAPDHTGLLRALMRLVDEHGIHGPGVDVLRRRVDAALNEPGKGTRHE